MVASSKSFLAKFVLVSEIEEILSVEANKPSSIEDKPNENLKEVSENTAKLQKILDFKEDKKNWFAEQEK